VAITCRTYGQTHEHGGESLFDGGPGPGHLGPPPKSGAGSHAHVAFFSICKAFLTVPTVSNNLGAVCSSDVGYENILDCKMLFSSREIKIIAS